MKGVEIRFRDRRTPLRILRADPAMTNATPLSLDARTTALVLIDLQQGILPYAKAPYDAGAVLANAVPLRPDSPLHAWVARVDAFPRG